MNNASVGNVGVERQTEISREVKSTSEALKCLADKLGALSNKLLPVRTSKPSNPSGETCPDAKLCEVAEAIRKNRKEIDRAINFIDTIIDEIEI